MSTAFPHTIRALKTDRFHGSAAVILFLAVLLVLWLAWFLKAGIARFEVTTTARLEIDREARTIQSPFLARVFVNNMAIGREVAAGDVLVELDTNTERLRVKEEQTRVATIASQIESLRTEIAARGQARTSEHQATGIALEESAARFQEADALARQSEADLHRLELLRKEGLAPERDFEQTRLEAERRRHATESLRLTVNRLEGEQKTRESDRDVQVANLEGQIHKLESDRATSVATIARLEYDVEQKRIRAPLAGRIAEAEELRPGAVVDEGEKLGAILPSGKLRAVAEFPPAAAFGRISRGQNAKIRLDGFPWAQYGAIPAKVSGVAGEIRDGHVRVELDIDASAAVRVPLQHGLPGSVEIEVERLTPAAMVLRAAGRLVAAPRTGVGQTP